jgi:hypothetical protein
MNDNLFLHLQAKKYQLLKQLLLAKQQVIDNAIRYKEKATTDVFYGGAYNVTCEFIQSLEALSEQIERLFGDENHE